jgi:type IV pilus assembly protein PilM
MATLTKKNNKFRLENCDIAVFEKECFNEQGEVLDFNYIKSTVLELINRQKYKCRNVVMAIPHRMIVSDIVSLPIDMPVDEQNYQLEVEANRMLPPSVGASFDYFLSPMNAAASASSTQSSSNTSNNTMVNSSSPSHSFNIMAVSKDVVEDRMKILQESKKLKPIVIDSDAIAALRNTYYVWHAEGSLDQVRVLLHLGHSGSYMFVIHNQDIVYQQNLVTNGHQLTQTIMRYYDMPFTEAERKKRTLSLPAGYNDDVLTPYLENTVIDVIQGIQNFFSTSSLSRVDGIYISGGHSLIEGLPTQVAKKTHINTQVFNPFLGLLRSTGIDEATLRKNMPSYTTSIGLALRGFES